LPPSDISETALLRIASALVRPNDEFPEDLTPQAIVERLSPQDRTIITNVIRRLCEVEADSGPAAAEAALGKVVAVLRRERGADC
jgi:hypothetical protein